MKVTNAPAASVLARAAILFAALSAVCLLLAGPSRSYCADPATGGVLAHLPLPDPGQDYVTAVASRYVYYVVPAGSGGGFYLRRLGIPAGCRVG